MSELDEQPVPDLDALWRLARSPAVSLSDRALLINAAADLAALRDEVAQVWALVRLDGDADHGGTLMETVQHALQVAAERGVTEGREASAAALRDEVATYRNVAATEMHNADALRDERDALRAKVETVQALCDEATDGPFYGLSAAKVRSALAAPAAVLPPAPACRCTMLIAQTLGEPAAWEQADDCPVHPLHPAPSAPTECAS